MKKLLYTTIAILGFANFATAQVPSYVPTNGLVGYWPFNGNANDASINGNNGVVSGATSTTDRFGIVNSAYSFNNNYIVIPSSNSLNIKQGSLSFWLNSNDTNLMVPIKKNYYNGAINEQFSFALNYTNLFSLKYNSSCQPGIGWFNTGGRNSLLTNGNWHMVSVTFSSDIKVYVDGYLTSSLLAPLTNADSCSSDIQIGREWSSNPNYFIGKLDDIGIWNRVLTQTEISKLYNANLCYQTITVTDTLVINVNRTGYNPVTYSNTLKVYPNPTKDRITIDNGDITKMSGYSIKIFNSLGQQKFQSAINQQQFTIDITQWGGNGLYFLNLLDASGNIIDVKKILLN
jgi:hypothetical protein